jgi:hypothetical protein
MLLQVTLCMASNYITPNMAYTGKGRAEMARRREVACKKYVFHRVFLSKQPIIVCFTEARLRILEIKWNIYRKSILQSFLIVSIGYSHHYTSRTQLTRTRLTRTPHELELNQFYLDLTQFLQWFTPVNSILLICSITRRNFIFPCSNLDRQTSKCQNTTHWQVRSLDFYSDNDHLIGYSIFKRNKRFNKLRRSLGTEL